jgi:hypothetical protein
MTVRASLSVSCRNRPALLPHGILKKTQPAAAVPHMCLGAKHEADAMLRWQVYFRHNWPAETSLSEQLRG